MRDPGVLLSVRKQAIWKEILQKTRLTNYKNHTGREHVAANVVPAFLCLRSFSMPPIWQTSTAPASLPPTMKMSVVLFQSLLLEPLHRPAQPLFKGYPGGKPGILGELVDGEPLYWKLNPSIGDAPKMECPLWS